MAEWSLPGTRLPEATEAAEGKAGVGSDTVLVRREAEAEATTAPVLAVGKRHVVYCLCM